MEHVLTMANLKLKPSLFTPRPNIQCRFHLWYATSRSDVVLHLHIHVQTRYICILHIHVDASVLTESFLFAHVLL